MSVYCRDCKTVESAGGDDNVKLCERHAQTQATHPVRDFCNCVDCTLSRVLRERDDLKAALSSAIGKQNAQDEEIKRLRTGLSAWNAHFPKGIKETPKWVADLQVALERERLHANGLISVLKQLRVRFEGVAEYHLKPTYENDATFSEDMKLALFDTAAAIAAHEILRSEP